jgi:hypothetical protein
MKHRTTDQPWLGLDSDFRMSNVHRGTTLWHQVATLVRIRAETQLNSVLEVGSGRGVTGMLLKHLGFEYHSLADLAPQRPQSQPLLQTASERGVADIVVAFQVLEHNALESFGTLLNKLAQLSRRFVVISLPISNPYIHFGLEPKLWSGYSTTSFLRMGLTIYFPRRLLPRPTFQRVNHFTQVTRLAPSVNPDGTTVFDSPKHLWEVGEPGAKLRQLKKIFCQQQLSCVRVSYPQFFPKQVFLELEKE